MSEFDYIVIGAGSGGLATAKRAAEHGAKVAIVERSRFGGTCVNQGCVPKKVMFYASGLQESHHHMQQYGFKCGTCAPPANDCALLKQRRDAYIARLNKVHEANLEKSGVTMLRGNASFVGPNSLLINDKTYTPKHICIATGSRPLIPAIPGAELGMTSDDFFNTMTEYPPSIAIVGAGYIAVELASVLQRMGTAVTLVIRHEEFLRTYDPLCRRHLMACMTQAGVKIVKNSVIERVTKGDDGLMLEVESPCQSTGAKCAEGTEGTATGTCTEPTGTTDGTEADTSAEGPLCRLGPFSNVLWAIGRAPQTDRLGLDKAGITTRAGGFIQVDEYQNTSVPGVYALGDVVGHVQLTPVAIRAGRLLSERLFNNRPEAKMNFENIPTVIFSHPPIGSVGLTEEQAVSRYGRDKINVYTSNSVDLYYGIFEPEQRQRTLIKLITLGEQETCIGIHMIGMSADEMIQGFSIAVANKLPKSCLDNTVAIHPTAGEELVTLRFPDKPNK